MTIFGIGSMTQSIKTRKILESEGVRIKIVKLDSTQNLHGCSYGIEFRDEDLLRVAKILRDRQIAYSAYKEKNTR